MSDKELLNYAKAYRALTKTTAELSNDIEDQKRFEIIDWLIKQAEKVEQLQQESEKLFEQKESMWKTIDYQQKQLQQAQAKLKRYENALQNIIDWGHLGGSYTDLSAALTFQKIAKKELEGEK